MSRVGHRDEPRAGYALGEPARMALRRSAIRGADHHHGRHRYLAEPRVTIFTRKGPHDRQQRTMFVEVLVEELDEHRDHRR
jgi:hypothetical protein